jgi:hypothetical protein
VRGVALEPIGAPEEEARAAAAPDLATSSPAASSTSSTALPSTTRVAMPRLAARASGPAPPVSALVRVVAAKPLSSQTKSIGRS